ncbi:MAG: FG-GAP-like repeat-containing protein [Candidatus Altiarchaeota archaeon]
MKKELLITLGLLLTGFCVIALQLDPARDVIITPGRSGFASDPESVNTRGDLNGDGIKDLVVGAAYPNRTVLVYYGGADFDNSSDAIISDHTDQAYFGYAVGVGDLNGDGIDDLAVVASTSNRTYVYLGNPEFDTASDLTITAPNNIYSISVCDLNNDGYKDLALGAAFYDNKTYIYYGNSTLDSTVDVTVDEHVSERYFGWAQACCDLNSDGSDDLAVGSYNDKKAYVYYGGSSFDNVSDVNITDHTATSYFGKSIACGGDLNDDSADDLVIGSSTIRNPGLVYVYYGGTALDGTSDLTISDHSDNYYGEALSNGGDVNGDGIDDLIVTVGSTAVDAYVYYGSSSFDGTSDVTFDHTQINYAVDSTGDLNDDGVSDIALGALLSGSNLDVYYGVSSLANRETHRIYSSMYNAQPVVLTVQGKLTESATGTAVQNGSIQVTVLSSSGTQLWQNTYNNSISSGVFNFALGATKELKLREDTRYRLKVEIDTNSTAYAAADVTYGDNNPAGDIIMFTV